MKAHIQQEPRCALVWRVSPGSAAYEAVEHAARPYRVRVRAVSEEALGMRIGDLCAGRTAQAAGGTAPTELPALIVSGLRHDNGDLNAFLDGVRRGGAQFPLRAMVTDTSRGWTLETLLTELCREHKAVEDPT